MQLQPKDFAKLANTKPANLSNGIRNGRISEHYIMRDARGRVASINAAALADWIALSRPAVTITREWPDVAAEYLGPNWGPPPWSAEQWQTVAMVVDLAREAATHS